jgi:hypothetical protein
MGHRVDCRLRRTRVQGREGDSGASFELIGRVM